MAIPWSGDGYTHEGDREKEVLPAKQKDSLPVNVVLPAASSCLPSSAR